MRRLGALGVVLAIALLALGLGGGTTASATVLCKTATNPCSGNFYGKGTTVEASLKSGTKSVLHSPSNDIECTSSSIKGEVTSPGGVGSNASGTVSSLSFGGCNATVSVLKKGTFTIESPAEGNGTLKLEGLEITTEFLSTHCIYAGPASFSLNGGGMAVIAGPSSLRRTGGNSGLFCGTLESSQAWTAEYTITAPEPLYVEEP